VALILGKKALRHQDKCILPFLNCYADGLINDGGKDISSGNQEIQITKA